MTIDNEQGTQKPEEENGVKAVGVSIGLLSDMSSRIACVFPDDIADDHSTAFTAICALETVRVSILKSSGIVDHPSLREQCSAIAERVISYAATVSRGKAEHTMEAFMAALKAAQETLDAVGAEMNRDKHGAEGVPSDE